MKKLIKTIALSTIFMSTAILTNAQENTPKEERFEHGDASAVYQQNPEHNKEGYVNVDKDGDRKNRNLFSKKDFGLYLGLNTFDKTVRTPELDQWKSRYVALQWRKNHNLITGKQVDVAIGTGFEFAWNNYMYQEDIELIKDNEGLSDFYVLDYDAKKAKLVVNNFNIPLMLQFGFKESGFRFGVGAYGGVRINSYQRFREFNGGKDRIKDDYNLRKFNYGLMAEAGKDDFRLFVKYDMNPLFNNNNPVNANPISFGVRF